MSPCPTETDVMFSPSVSVSLVVFVLVSGAISSGSSVSKSTSSSIGAGGVSGVSKRAFFNRFQRSEIDRYICRVFDSEQQFGNYEFINTTE